MNIDSLFSLFLDKESEEEMKSDDENQYPVIEKVVPRRKLGNSDDYSLLTLYFHCI